MISPLEHSPLAAARTEAARQHQVVRLLVSDPGVFAAVCPVAAGDGTLEGLVAGGFGVLVQGVDVVEASVAFAAGRATVIVGRTTIFVGLHSAVRLCGLLVER